MTPDEIQDAVYAAYRDSPAFARKAFAWEEIGTLVPRSEHADMIRALPRYAHPGHPLDTFGDVRPQFYVETVGDDFYLVNTEGFDYARYIARLPDRLFGGDTALRDAAPELLVACRNLYAALAPGASAEARSAARSFARRVIEKAEGGSE